MYIVISFSHQNTNVEVREKLHFSDEESIKILTLLKNIDKIDEIMLLSTCNRCEFYMFLESYLDNPNLESSIINNVINIISTYKNIDKNEISTPLILSDNLAIKHIFCVASSLLSLVIGETQISGQLKQAFNLSKENGFCSKNLNRLINYAFRCASSVRVSTDISKNPVSVASIMVNLALEFMQNSLESKKHNILIIGVGEMGVLSLKYLSRHNFNITLCNRTRKNAENILESLKIKANILDFNDLKTQLNNFDIVISAVAGGVMITEYMLEFRAFNRIFFDLSIPRNISFGSASFGTTSLKNRNEKLDSILQNIEVVCVDDLKVRAQKHIDSRKEKMAQAMQIVDKFVIDFYQYLSSLEIEPLIKLMRLRAKEASLKEINRAIKKGFLPEALRDNITKLAHSIFNEYLHIPTMNLRSISEENNADESLESIYKFFGANNKNYKV